MNKPFFSRLGLLALASLGIKLNREETARKSVGHENASPIINNGCRHVWRGPVADRTRKLLKRRRKIARASRNFNRRAKWESNRSRKAVVRFKNLKADVLANTNKRLALAS